MPILKTRLYKPIVKEHYVNRERIHEYLDLHTDNSLVLFIAPAGYGKSVTTSQWVERRGCKYGWISLDSDCNDLSVFLSYLVSAIQLVYPSLLNNIKELCSRTDLPSTKVISKLFINDTANLDEDFILVLDDYHLINNQSVHDLLNDLLKYLPERLKLVILSRRDPLLQLSSLKAYDRVSEIRMSELKFDTDELIELSQKTMPKTMDYETASELVTLTEGWIIGLKMAIHSMEQGHELKQILSGLGSEMRTITQFLTDEILQSFTPWVQECFYKASILSRCCKNLLIDICDAEELEEERLKRTGNLSLEEITNKTLFIIPLDADQVWFRFHHLFGEFLYKQLEKKYNDDQISGLHRKASCWFERNGYFDEALNHATIAGDLEFANQILENQLTNLFDNEQLSLLDRWLKMFPANAINKYVSLNLIQAFFCDFNQDLIGMEKALKTAYKILVLRSAENDKDNTRWGCYYTLNSMLLYKTGKIKESLLSSEQAMELLHCENSYMRDNALLYHCFALIATGKLTEAERKADVFRGLIQSDDQLGQARNSLVTGYISFFSGNLPHIYSSLHPVINYYKRNLFNISGSMAYYYLGFVNYQWNHLNEAGQFFNDTWEHRFASGPRWILNSIYIQILTCQANGDKTQVNSLFEKAHQYVEELGMPVYDQLLACMEIEIALKEKDFNRIEKFRYVADFDQYKPYCFYYIPQLTRIKLKIAEAGVNYISEPQKELSDIIEYLSNTHNTTLLIQALTLQTVVFKQEEKMAEALKCLSKAVNMARSAGFIRVFVDGGNDVRDLLILLQKDNQENYYLNKILEVFSAVINPGKKNSIHRYYSLSMGDNLTHQDIEILKMLENGLQNKQIAEKLFLSPNSIKKYVYDIFKKLEVNKRSSAVEKAKMMEII